MFLPALVCVFVCLSAITITKKIVDGCVPDFMGRLRVVLRSVEGCGSNGNKLRKPAIVYIVCITSMVMINRTHSRRMRCT